MKIVNQTLNLLHDVLLVINIDRTTITNNQYLIKGYVYKR